MIAIKNLTKIAVDKSFLTGVAKIVLKGENISKEKELSIVLVNEPKIKELNKKYRNKNGVTDVLSFANVSSATIQGVRLRASSKFHVSSSELGEVVICPGEVKKNAKKINSIFKKELIFVLIHGVLHLLGYNHEMSKKEAEIMDKKTKKYLLKINS